MDRYEILNKIEKFERMDTNDKFNKIKKEILNKNDQNWKIEENWINEELKRRNKKMKKMKKNEMSKKIEKMKINEVNWINEKLKKIEKLKKLKNVIEYKIKKLQ